MTKKPSVDIIILNYNGLEDTIKCLQSLIKSKYNNFKAYIVDNGSKVNEAEQLKKEFKDKRLNFIRFNSNFGFAGGNNRQIKKCKSKYVVFLNNDTIVNSDWMAEPIRLLEKDNTISAVQPKILSLENPKYFDYAGAAGGYLDKLGYPYARGRIGFHLEQDVGQYNNLAEIFWGSGTCLFIRRKIFDISGGFPESFFFYHEETDLCWRMNNLGYKIVYSPRSSVSHKGASSSKKQMDKRIFFVHRNNLLMLIRNMSIKRLLIALPIRFMLDFLSVFFYAFTGPANYSLSVIKAYISFFELLPGEFQNRPKTSGKYKAETLMKPLSIYFEYFIRAKHKYSEIFPNGKYSAKLIYYGNMISLDRVNKSNLFLRKLSDWLKKDRIFPVIILILLTLIFRTPSLSLPLDRDEGAYGYLGWSWLTDRLVIYKDHFDHKPPLTYVVYGLVSILGGNSSVNIRIFSIFYFIFTLLVFYYLLKKLYGGLEAFVLSIILLTLISTTLIEGWGFNTEAIFIPWVLLGTGLVNLALKKNINSYYFMSGLFIGIAGMIKQVAYLPGVLIGFCLFILLLFRKDVSFKQLALYIFGAILPLGVFLLYFHYHNSLKDFYIANWVANRKYISHGYDGENIKRFANAPNVFLGYLKLIFTTRAIEVSASLILFVISMVGFLRARKFRDLIISSASVLGIYLGVKLAGGRHVGHYYLPVVWSSVFVSAGIFYYKFNLNKRLLLIILVIAFGYKFILIATTDGVEISTKQFGETQMKWFLDSESLGKYLEKNININDKLYMWGNEAEIYYYSKTVSPIYFMQFYIQDSYPNGWQIWKDDLYSANIDYIITYKQPEAVPYPDKLESYIKNFKTTEINVGNSFRLIRLEK